MGMTSFFRRPNGQFYHGDMVPGDRPATMDELVERNEVARRLQAAAHIRALEVEQIMPRATREFMLGYLEERGTPEQLALLPAYVKLKAFDSTIAGLRAVIRGDA
jgi:hypothetical protein